MVHWPHLPWPDFSIILGDSASRSQQHKNWLLEGVRTVNNNNKNLLGFKAAICVAHKQIYTNLNFLNLKTYFTFIYLCLCVCRPCVDSIQGEQNGTLDAPELELQEVVKCQLGCEELNFGPLQEQSKLSIIEPSLQIFSIENYVFRTEIFKKKQLWGGYCEHPEEYCPRLKPRLVWIAPWLYSYWDCPSVPSETLSHWLSFR